MMSERIELRAKRLRAEINVLQSAENDRLLMALAYVADNSEDRDLAETCLEAERDLRRREWDAIELLLAAIPLGGGLEEIYELPAYRALPAIRAAQVCGWLRPCVRA